MATITKERFNPQRTASHIAAAILEQGYTNADLSSWGLNEKQAESVIKQVEKIIDKLKSK